MTTTSPFARNAVAAALVVAMLALGSAFGFFLLGGTQTAPSNAVVPATETTCGDCTLLIGSSGSGGAPGSTPGLSGSGSGGGIDIRP